MVIDSMFVYHFVDPELRIEIFFQKEGTAENGGVDFEIVCMGISEHLHWWLKIFLLFYYFFGHIK